MDFYVSYYFRQVNYFYRSSLYKRVLVHTVVVPVPDEGHSGNNEYKEVMTLLSGYVTQEFKIVGRDLGLPNFQVKLKLGYGEICIGNSVSLLHKNIEEFHITT